jgi:AcrR family transcriptional regulator
MTPERPDRLADIMHAAYVCFVRHGVRRTTMDDIASEAGMSRAAVYQYVANKQDAFRRLAEILFTSALRAAREAAARPDPLPDRLFAVLATKLELTLRLYRDSPHAAEMLDESVKLTGDLVASYTRDLVAIVAETLATAPVPEPAEVAEIAVALVRGLEADLTDPDLPRLRLRRAVDLLTSGYPKGAKK